MKLCRVISVCAMLAAGNSAAATARPPRRPPLETHQEHYPDGALASQYTYYSIGGARARKHGYEIHYYPSGARFKQTTFVDGQRHGKVASWYPDGKLKEQGTFFRNLPHGAWLQWYPDGRNKSELHYTHGKLDGPWRQWYEDGHERASGAYRDGTRDGVFISWYEDGTKARELHYRDGKRHGRCQAFFKDGKPRLDVQYADNVLEGAAKVWAPDGTLLVDGVYRAGEPYHGSFREAGNQENEYYLLAYHSGKLEDSIFYADDKPKTGTVTEWHLTGVKWRECEYRDGRKNGRERWWYRDGNLMSECTWESNRLEGPYIEYFPDGKSKRHEVECHQGLKQGREVIWDRHGKEVASGENRNDMPWEGTLMVRDRESGESFLKTFSGGRVVGLPIQFADDAGPIRPAAASAPRPRFPAGDMDAEPDAPDTQLELRQPAP